MSEGGKEGWKDGPNGAGVDARGRREGIAGRAAMDQRVEKTMTDTSQGTKKEKRFKGKFSPRDGGESRV